MSDRTLTEAEHQILCNALTREQDRLRALEEDGFSVEFDVTRLEDLTDAVYAAKTVRLEGVARE